MTEPYSDNMIPLHVFNHTVKDGIDFMPQEFACRPSMLYSGYEPYDEDEYYEDALKHGLIVEKPYKGSDLLKTVSLTKKGFDYVMREYPLLRKYKEILTVPD